MFACACMRDCVYLCAFMAVTYLYIHAFYLRAYVVTHVCGMRVCVCRVWNPETLLHLSRFRSHSHTFTFPLLFKYTHTHTLPTSLTLFTYTHTHKHTHTHTHTHRSRERQAFMHCVAFILSSISLDRWNPCWKI